VVSMPCVEVFLRQSKAYQESVLPCSIKARLAIEAGAKMSWYRFVGRAGKILGIDRFGESAPYMEIFDALELTVETVENMIGELLV